MFLVLNKTIGSRIQYFIGLINEKDCQCRRDIQREEFQRIEREYYNVKRKNNNMLRGSRVTQYLTQQSESCARMQSRVE